MQFDGNLDENNYWKKKMAQNTFKKLFFSKTLFFSSSKAHWRSEKKVLSTIWSFKTDSLDMICEWKSNVQASLIISRRRIKLEEFSFHSKCARIDFWNEEYHVLTNKFSFSRKDSEILESNFYCIYNLLKSHFY